MMHNTETKSESAERTVGPLSIDGPQPAWMTLTDAREQSFTGELVFEGEPDVLAYLDHGIVYYAEEANGPSLGRRLLDAGVVDGGQLDRGTVRVGDIEHLGRLFDRDPSIDRDAVTVMTETFTEDIVMRLANDAVANVRVTAYRHHPSGLHRWFVAPVESASAPRPVGVVSPLDSTVLDDLPGMGRSVDDLVEELTIEWDEPFEGADEIEVLPAVDTTDDAVADFLADVEPQEDTERRDDLDVELLVPSDVDEDDASTENDGVLDMVSYVDLDTTESVDAVDASDDADLDAENADDNADGELSLAAELDADEEFDIIWPNGHVDVATEPVADEPTDLVVDVDDADDADDVAGADALSNDVHFELPEVEVAADDDVATAEVDDDVADAVRRALAAIETATFEPTTDDGIADVERDEPLPVVDSPAVQVVDTEPTVAPAAAFAPPTLDMSAEAIYARATEQAATAEQPTLPAATPEVETGDVGGDRSSALRRLIRSLGRKDR